MYRGVPSVAAGVIMVAPPAGSWASKVVAVAEVFELLLFVPVVLAVPLVSSSLPAVFNSVVMGPFVVDVLVVVSSGSAVLVV